MLVGWLLKVEDQMKLLESSWSELLLLELLYRQLDHSDTHQLLMVRTVLVVQTLPALKNPVLFKKAQVRGFWGFPEF